MSTTLAMTELRRLTMDELRKELMNARVEYAKVRMHVTQDSEKNHSKVKTLRRHIARMEMALTEMRSNMKGAEGAKGTEVSKRASTAKKSEKKTSETSATSVPSVSPRKKK